MRITSIALFAALSSPAFAEDEPTKVTHPLSAEMRKTLRTQHEAVLKQNPVEDGKKLSVNQHSRRGDALFFLGRFDECVEEYEAMVKLDPSLDASHWRLGIAYFFAKNPKKGAAQFDKYHVFDDVDRENGIWRYLCQYHATDAKTAKKELLKYEKDDREPFPAVYKLFDDSLSPEQVLAKIPKDLPETQKDMRLFYSELYIGMHLVVKKKPNQAARYLALATSRKWPQRAGFGPNYMWHVGRVQLEQLLKAKKQSTDR